MPDTAAPRIVVLAGGVGGARYLRGVRAWLRERHPDADPARHLTAVVNTGDDMWLAGLRITPDLDSIMYSLAGVNDTVRGWGRVGETERVSAELQAWGVGWPWFTLGDLDLGAHIARSAWLREGVPLSTVVARLTARWELGARLLPATDQEVETQVVVDRAAVDGPESPDAGSATDRELHFQEWWTRYRAGVPARRFVQRGVETARPAAGVTEAIAAADVVLLAPSNPVVSIGTVLGIPGIREALRSTAAPVVGVSPIIGGAVVRGMADACLTAIGVETSAEAVARLYGSRSGAADGILDGWLVDEVDAEATSALTTDGIRTIARPLWMTDDAASAAIVDTAIELGSEARPRGLRVSG